MTTVYVPTINQLQGLTLETAECFGKPHVNAQYVGYGVNRYVMEKDAICPICGRRAVNVHHQPPKGRGRFIRIGSHILRPSLFGLCGSGTTGCHGRIHSGKLKVSWCWLDDDFSQAWWEGKLFSRLKPHDQKLYDYGYWNFEQNIPDNRLFEDSHIFLN